MNLPASPRGRKLKRVKQVSRSDERKVVIDRSRPDVCSAELAPGRAEENR